MNPIANLPATQNLNKAQQSQGYNRQYFGGDEVDEVVLSNQEEQKKKKAWTIGGAILGAMALIGGCVFGANYFGYMGKDAKHLKGFKTLTTKNGDTTQELASIAKTTKAWTGASWGGVAETIKTTLDGKNDTKFKKIVLVASEDSQKALKESLGEDLFKKLTVIQANSDKIEDAVNSAAKYGKDKDNLIITDSSIDNLYDEIEKAITPSDNSAAAENAKEEKKAKKEQNPTEASKASEAEQKEEADEKPKEATAEPEVIEQPSVQLNSVEDARTTFNTLIKMMNEADLVSQTCKESSKIKGSNYETEVGKFETTRKNYLSFKTMIDKLETYCQEETQKFEKDNNQIKQELDTNYTDEALNKKLENKSTEESLALRIQFNKDKQALIDKSNKNEAKLNELNHLKTDIDKEQNPAKHKFISTYNENYNRMKALVLASTPSGKNKLIWDLCEGYNTLVESINDSKKTLETEEKTLKNMKDCNYPKDQINTKSNEIEEKKKEISQAEQNAQTNLNNIKKAQNTLTKLYQIFADDSKAEQEAVQQTTQKKQQAAAQEEKQKFDNSITLNIK